MFGTTPTQPIYPTICCKYTIIGKSNDSVYDEVMIAIEIDSDYYFVTTCNVILWSSMSIKCKIKLMAMIS